MKETLLRSGLQRRVTKASEWGEISTCQLSVLALWCWEAFRFNLPVDQRLKQPLACVWLNVKRMFVRQNNSIHGKEGTMNFSYALKCLLNDATL